MQRSSLRHLQFLHKHTICSLTDEECESVDNASWTSQTITCVRCRSAHPSRDLTTWCLWENSPCCTTTCLLRHFFFTAKILHFIGPSETNCVWVQMAYMDRVRTLMIGWWLVSIYKSISRYVCRLRLGKSEKSWNGDDHRWLWPQKRSKRDHCLRSNDANFQVPETWRNQQTTEAAFPSGRCHIYSRAQLVEFPCF